MSSPRQDSRERGASAVEFALVVPILLALMLGIVDYGFWFNDSLNVRQGVREGARQAVVQNYNSVGGTCSGAGGSLDKAACATATRIGSVTGPTWVRVRAYKQNGSNGWEAGGQLLVCGQVRADGLTGFTPVPSDGLIRSVVVMRIEQDDSPPGSSSGDYASASGSVPSWSTWCSV